MNALKIEDLRAARDLDDGAMSDVIGGCCCAYTPGWDTPAPGWGAPKPSSGSPNVTFNVVQSLGQSQNTVVNNGNNVAFASGINANVNPSQNGRNTINFA